ncbi:hypothetical protein SUNI508_07741 [Seiridium unicorne]|uniref:Uncharacterized protein n=1 Tax=Seiridium unicorne TaxID=138068 RepID=A0ABR2UWR8_9PEZI
MAKSPQSIVFLPGDFQKLNSLVQDNIWDHVIASAIEPLLTKVARRVYVMGYAFPYLRVMNIHQHGTGWSAFLDRRPDEANLVRAVLPLMHLCKGSHAAVRRRGLFALIPHFGRMDRGFICVIPCRSTFRLNIDAIEGMAEGARWGRASDMNLMPDVQPRTPAGSSPLLDQLKERQWEHLLPVSSNFIVSAGIFCDKYEHALATLARTPGLKSLWIDVHEGKALDRFRSRETYLFDNAYIILSRPFLEDLSSDYVEDREQLAALKLGSTIVKDSERTTALWVLEVWERENMQKFMEIWTRGFSERGIEGRLVAGEYLSDCNINMYMEAMQVAENT